MLEEELTPKTMLQDLLLNQVFYKREVCQIVQISMRLLNDILALEENKYQLNPSVIRRIKRLYERMKGFEDKIEEILVQIPKRKKNTGGNNHSFGI